MNVFGDLRMDFRRPHEYGKGTLHRRFAYVKSE